jgi:hypothetical protein
MEVLMKTRTMFTAFVGLTIAGALALTGCTGNAKSPEDLPAAQGSDEASAFLACLTAADVDAKINTSGQVLVKTSQQFDAGGTISSDTGNGDVLTMESDDSGNLWVAPASSSYFIDDPDTQDAYATCEREHPDFAQPEFDPSSDPGFQQDQAKQEEAALAFAQCARENGFTQIADPNPEFVSGIMIPDDFTESDFRTLAEACYKADTGFGFAHSDDLGFEPWKILEESQNTPAS